MKKLILLLATALFAGVIPVHAATLILKDGKSMSKVKVISINFAKKFMIIESDGQRRTISTSRISEFYSTDRESGNNTADIDNTTTYNVSILNVKMPKTGYKRSSSKKRKSSSSSYCEILYTISTSFPKKGDTTNRNVIKYPYFYLAVLTEGSSEYGGRPIFRFTYPKHFKLDSKAKKSYNTAAIMDALNSLKRPHIYLDRIARMGSRRKSNKISGQREIKIKLSSVKSRRIIGYHLEVWGKEKLLQTKDWTDPGAHISSSWAKRWWLRH
jgi:hypothetical protein